MPARFMMRVVPVAGSLALALAPGTTRAQVTLEAHGAIGYTSVDVDAWAGTSNGAFDWTQVASAGFAKVLFQAGGIGVGAELGWAHLSGITCSSPPAVPRYCSIGR